MTDSRPSIRDRRQARAERSAARKQMHWAQRFTAAETPLDLVQQNVELLRTRIVQAERKAQRRVGRAASPERTAAVEELNEIRQLIERICGDAATELARLADEIQNERR